MEYDVQYAIVLHPKPATWSMLLSAQQTMRKAVRVKLSHTISQMIGDPVMQDAVRVYLNASDRHEVTRRDCFNYLGDTYAKAVMQGVGVTDWTVVLRAWPYRDKLYIALEVGGAVDYLSGILFTLGGQPFGVPGDTPSQTTYRQQRWTEIVEQGVGCYTLDVCTLGAWQEYSSECV